MAVVADCATGKRRGHAIDGDMVRVMVEAGLMRMVIIPVHIQRVRYIVWEKGGSMKIGSPFFV